MRRAADVVYEVVEGRAMIVDPSGKEILTLNPVGTLVWEALDGALDVDGLTDQLLPKLTGVTRDVLRRDVATFVDELTTGGLIAETTPGPS
jgi:hypothetical protein